MTSFFETAENTTQCKQYSKALQKTIMKKPFEFKHCKHNINPVNIIIFIYYNFIDPLSS